MFIIVTFVPSSHLVHATYHNTFGSDTISPPPACDKTKVSLFDNKEKRSTYLGSILRRCKYLNEKLAVQKINLTIFKIIKMVANFVCGR
ncbi:hypothetical protein Hanom_Chr12g01121941 [Helianthus anomalus]